MDIRLPMLLHSVQSFELGVLDKHLEHCTASSGHVFDLDSLGLQVKKCTRVKDSSRTRIVTFTYTFGKRAERRTFKSSLLMFCELLSRKTFPDQILLNVFCK